MTKMLVMLIIRFCFRKLWQRSTPNGSHTSTLCSPASASTSIHLVRLEAAIADLPIKLLRRRTSG